MAAWLRTRSLAPILILLLVGELFTSACATRRIRTIQTAGPNGVGSISAIGVGLMIVTFGFVAAVVVFGVEPLSIGG